MFHRIACSGDGHILLLRKPASRQRSRASTPQLLLSVALPAGELVPQLGHGRHLEAKAHSGVEANAIVSLSVGEVEGHLFVGRVIGRRASVFARALLRRLCRQDLESVVARRTA